MCVQIKLRQKLPVFLRGRDTVPDRGRPTNYTFYFLFLCINIYIFNIFNFSFIYLCIKLTAFNVIN